MPSAIEDSFESHATSVRAFLRSHDRGVIAGLALCCTPIPPAPLVGLLISLVNLYLLRSGKLPACERRTVLIALAVGTLNLMLAAVIVVSGYRAAVGVADWLSRTGMRPRLLPPGLRSIGDRWI